MCLCAFTFVIYSHSLQYFTLLGLWFSQTELCMLVFVAIGIWGGRHASQVLLLLFSLHLFDLCVYCLLYLFHQWKNVLACTSISPCSEVTQCSWWDIQIQELSNSLSTYLSHAHSDGGKNPLLWLCDLWVLKVQWVAINTFMWPRFQGKFFTQSLNILYLRFEWGFYVLFWGYLPLSHIFTIFSCL